MVLVYFRRLRAWQIAVVGAVSVIIAILAFCLGSPVTGVIFLLFGFVDLGFAYHRYYYIERRQNVTQSTATIGTTAATIRTSTVPVQHTTTVPVQHYTTTSVQHTIYTINLQ